MSIERIERARVYGKCEFEVASGALRLRVFLVDFFLSRIAHLENPLLVLDFESFDIRPKFIVRWLDFVATRKQTQSQYSHFFNAHVIVLAAYASSWRMACRTAHP
jgi:hypothetical protein